MPTTSPRFLKISAAGLVLPADATEFVAVQEAEPLPDGMHRFWSVSEAPKAQPLAKCATYARKLKLAGFTDWRLPTRIELLTLVDDTRHDPAIDVDAFPHCKSSWYWTSTPYARSPGVYAWFVYFNGGGSYWDFRSGSGFVRAVRVGQSLVVGPQP